MTGHGRGRPALFTGEHQDAYLDLVAAGVRLQEAAAKVGFDYRRITYARHTQPAFARRLAEARARGARVRADPTTWQHGSASTYNNLGCRCTPCRADATRARAASRGHAHPHPGEEENPAAGADVLPLPARPTYRPLANAS